MQPLVSIIIPVYNMEEFLSATLDSVLASTYPAIEVVVVDDGSTDRSTCIAQMYAERDQRVQLIRQPNSGPSRARNHGAAIARGKYLLPVDADNLIAPDFIHQAVEVMEAREEVKVVAPGIERIGEKRGFWHLPPFSLGLLARRNIIDTCALYRHQDFDRIKGYCEEIVAREDWDFWLSMLKDGGEVVRFSNVGLYYRVRKQSKRIADRRRDQETIVLLNRRHADLFERELGGPLRCMRSWSKCYNTLTRPFRTRRTVVAPGYSSFYAFASHLPESFTTEGKIIFRNRNTIKQIDLNGASLVVKEFALPHLFNRLMYRFFRSSKARRSFDYAQQLFQGGVGTPAPVAYCETGSVFLAGKAYYVTLRSTLTRDYRDLYHDAHPRQKEILTAIAQTIARMHDLGFWHKDLSPTNILWDFKPEGIAVELIDLNRMHLGQISQKKGCCNFDRLPATPLQHRILAEAYAQARGFSVETCHEFIVATRRAMQ